MKNKHYNAAMITGRMVDGLVFSHASDKTKYYKGTLAVQRLSGAVDFLPVVVPERTCEGLPDLQDKLVAINGQISSCNRLVNGKNRLVVDLFAHCITVLESGCHVNEVTLRGAVCRTPSFRLTPGGRVISDLLLAVNRPNGHSAYIPCIVWGDDARKVRDVSVGSTLEVTGRFQSRNYDKRHEDGTYEKRTAYEISAAKVVTEAE